MKIGLRTVPVVVSLLLGMNCVAAQSPPVPNSGQILQELERAQPAAPRVPKPASPDIVSRDATLRPGEAIDAQMRIRVVGYQISGSTLFEAGELLALVADHTGDMTLAQIEEAAGRITRHYRDRGYMVARAYLPYQEVIGGLVRLDVLEGRYGDVRLENSTRVSDRRIRTTLERAACKSGTCANDLIEEARLEKGMLRLADLPGIAVRGALQPGTQIGTADLVLLAQPTQGFSGSFEVSDTGGRYVGSERALLSLAYNNPFGFGDRATLQGAYSAGSTYASLGYDAPVNYRGTRLHVNGYVMDYELQKEFKALGAQGDTTGADIGLSQTFSRNSRFILAGRLTVDQKSITDEIEVTGSSNERDSRTFVAQLDGALNDTWFGTAALNRASLEYTRGKLDIEDAASLAIDAASARTQGNFDKVVYWLSREQQIGGRWSVYARVTGQWATENLDSSEKLYLGGPAAVRAYPVGEAAGDRGYLASAEVRRLLGGPFGGVTQAALFYDRGRVVADAYPWVAESGARTLQGYGASVSWNHPAGWTLSSSLARRGSEAVRSGPDRKNQFWISGGYRF
jgi:hemolysin activation/secretion protein